MHAVEAEGRIVGFLVVVVTGGDDLPYPPVAAANAPFVGLAFPVISFGFAGGVESTPRVVQQTPFRWTHKFDTGTLGVRDEDRAARDIAIAVSCKCGDMAECVAPSATHLLHLPVWTWLAGNGGPSGADTRAPWPHGGHGSDTSLAACVAACNKDLSCHAARFAFHQSSKPCLLSQSFAPGPTAQMAALIPMVHRCSPVRVKQPTIRATASGVARPLDWATAYLPRANQSLPPVAVAPATGNLSCCEQHGYTCSRYRMVFGASLDNQRCIMMVTMSPTPPTQSPVPRPGESFGGARRLTLPNGRRVGSPVEIEQWSLSCNTGAPCAETQAPTKAPTTKPTSAPTKGPTDHVVVGIEVGFGAIASTTGSRRSSDGCCLFPSSLGGVSRQLEEVAARQVFALCMHMSIHIMGLVCPPRPAPISYLMIQIQPPPCGRTTNATSGHTRGGAIQSMRIYSV